MNSIQVEITGTTVANQVRLEGAAHKGAFLLVEGNDDAKLFGKFCDGENCEIIICLGRERLLEAMATLERANFRRVLGIADRDYADFVDYPEYGGVVIFSDETDMDTMILASSAFDNVLREFGSHDRVSVIIDTETKSPRDLIFDAAIGIGALRLLSQERGLSLHFSEMSYQFEPGNSFQVDLQRTIVHVLGRTEPRPTISETDVLTLVKEYISRTREKRTLCNGHDCVRVLGKALRRSFGNTNQFDSGKGSRLLAGALRLAYDFEFFRQSAVYRSMRRWEDAMGLSVLQP